MKLFLFIIFNLLMFQGCAAQSQLPKEMPEKVSFRLNEGGGMTRAYKKISIENGVLEFEQLSDNGKNPNKWSAELSAEESAKLYQVFVETKFDTIKNDERKGIVHDAGSETISITVNGLKFFSVSYGKNSPLSGKNLSRYLEVQKTIDALVEKHQNPKNPKMNEAETFIQGKWRVTGENGGHAWFLEWTFDKGSFKQTGYPPIYQEGKYKIVDIADHKINLELYDQKGTFGEDKRIIEILIDKEANVLMISGTKRFSRSK